MAALRYGVMGAKGATPPAEEDEPYEDFRKRELMRRYDEQMDRPRRRYEWT